MPATVWCGRAKAARLQRPAQLIYAVCCESANDMDKMILAVVAPGKSNFGPLFILGVNYAKKRF